MMAKIFFLLALVFGIAGCSDNNTSSANGNSGAATGDLYGSVILTDYRGRYIADKSGVLVQFEGTAHSAITDANGKWAIHDLPTRTYIISFSKTGFTTWRDSSYSYIGGGKVYYYEDHVFGSSPVSLGEIPRFTVTLDAVVMPTYGATGHLFAHTSADAPDSTYVGLLLLTARTPDMDITDKSSYSYSQIYTSNNLGKTDTVVNITAQLDYSFGILKTFLPGETVYFKSYPILNGQNQFSPTTGTSDLIGYSLTASNVLSGIIQ